MNKLLKEKILSRLTPIPLIVSIFSLMAVLYDFGYDHQPYEYVVLRFVYLFALCIGAISIIVRYSFQINPPRLKVKQFDLFFLFILLLLILLNLKILDGSSGLMDILKLRFWVYVSIITIFIREFSSIRVYLKRTVINPAQLFIVSFLLIIIAGGFLLMLPKASNSNISFIDAMFTSTSAVCVTGLTVVNTGSFFTQFGQFIILVLIQIGGLGIMTFASYFSYFFKGSSTYENQLLLSDITNTEKIGEVFNTLKKIILVTFIFEAIGALLIFQFLDEDIIPTFSDRSFFSIFHSVSGFCNAGFSTLQNGLFEPNYQFNYPIHLIIAFLIILGGLGFPIVFNLLMYLRKHITNILLHISGKRERAQMPWIININTRVVLIASLALTIFGTIIFFIFEYNNTLSGYTFWGKVITSFFGSVTARTAGFNTVDTSILSYPTTLAILFLMWVGASPASTGGGIKTSTLALAMLNLISLVKGKARIEVFKREIAQTSVNRAFAIIVLSILVICIAIFSISIFDREKGMLNITFECVSAFGTVGLSRGITADLSTSSKVVLVLTMFIGRVSMLTVMIAIFKRVTYSKYHYPSENILIN
ncbi:MAG: ATPase [Bacteroidales bacterium]|nr:MAG: ATPase [Bacteroidales bacterium]